MFWRLLNLQMITDYFILSTRVFMRNKCILDWTETKGYLLNFSVTHCCLCSFPPFTTQHPPQTNLHSTPHVWVDCASSFCHAQICYAGERSLEFAFYVCSKALDLKSGHVICQISESIFCLYSSRDLVTWRDLLFRSFLLFLSDRKSNAIKINKVDAHSWLAILAYYE